MEEDNVNGNPEAGNAEGAQTPDLGKFKSVDARVRAYGELESEFTRRSQRLKALEEAEKAREAAAPAEPREVGSEELYRQAKQNEGVCARLVSEYLQSLKGVPLMTGSGAGVAAPADRPRNLREAGNLALGYLRNQKN